MTIGFIELGGIPIEPRHDEVDNNRLSNHGLLLMSRSACHWRRLALYSLHISSQSQTLLA
jgi:hypothetical protein